MSTEPVTSEPVTGEPATASVRIAVTHGNPTPQEVAAVGAALLGIAAATPTRPAVRRTPAWGRASRMEATGQAPFTSSTDPRLSRRPSGALPPGAV